MPGKSSESHSEIYLKTEQKYIIGIKIGCQQCRRPVMLHINPEEHEGVSIVLLFPKY